MHKPTNKSLMILTLLAGLMLLTGAFIFLDPDFDWHIRMGKIITDSGIPSTDPLSYTMPSYRFIDHEWLTNVILSKVYPLIGYLGLAIVYAFLTLSSFYLITKISLTNVKKPFPLILFLCLILSFGTVFPFFGIRPQVESWLLFSVLLAFLYIPKIWKKYAFFIPLLTLLWVNLHGSFALSSITLLIYVILKSLRERHLSIKDWSVLLLNVLASFINPYGPRVWYEVWQQITDNKLRFVIMEWRPAFFSFNLSYISLLVLSVFLIIRYRKHFKTELLGINFFYMLQSLSSARHEPIWVLSNFPMLFLALNLTLEETRKIKFGRERLFSVLKTAIFIFFTVAATQSLIHLYSVSRILSEREFYPAAAVAFLKSNMPAGQMFSQYGWGGYLSLNLPEKRVFIDGRMPSWKRKDAPSGESRYAMEEYMDIISGEADYKEYFRKYDIRTVLWTKKEFVDPFSIVEKKNKKVFNPLYNLFGIKNRDFKLVDTLKKDGWRQVYSDNVSVIMQK